MMVLTSLFSLMVPTVYADSAEGKVRIANIWVNDFTSSYVAKNAEGDILIDDQVDFQIVYIHTDGSFLLSILKSPFHDIKARAENAFLKRLGIGRPAGCRLDVKTSTLNAINPEESNKIYALPFCALQTLADINQNCVVEKDDLNRLKLRYPYSGFDAEEDVNGDGITNALDVSIVVQFLGTTSVCPEVVN